MDLLLTLVTNAAILFVAWKLYRWSRRQARAGRAAWRRRVGLVFLLAPVLLTIGKVLPGVPDWALRPIEWVTFANHAIDGALGALVGAAKDALPGPIAYAVKPLCYALVYGGLGVLLGWPLDRLAARRAGAAQADEGGGQSDGSSPA
jgi:hypothetical protein